MPQPYPEQFMPTSGLSGEALEYIHEDEHFRKNAPDVWQRHKGFINKSMSLSNLNPQDELILFDLLDILAASAGFTQRAKDITCQDLNDEDNAYALSLAHISVGRGGFGRKAIITQIKIMQAPGDKQPGFFARHNPFGRK